MENRHNRRQFLKGLGALVAGTALAVSSPLAYSAEPKPEPLPLPRKPIEEEDLEGEKVPSYEDFRAQLIKNKQYDEKREEDLKEYWGGLKHGSTKIRRYIMVSDPEKFFKKYIPDEEVRADLRKAKFTEEQKKDLQDYFKIMCPWKFNPNELPDKIYLYDFLKASESFRKRLPGYKGSD